MIDIPDNSIHLIVTSPPYNVGKEYEGEPVDWIDYFAWIRPIIAECYRVLMPGCKFCLNIANIGRRPYIPLNTMFTDACMKQGFYIHGEIIWDKQVAARGDTAWGSWLSAKAPVLRDRHEYIIVFSKDQMHRDDDGVSTINRDEFMLFTKSVWTMRPASESRSYHPAAFPDELPYRLIQLYSYKNDVVLDPFCGSGTTCAVALANGRRYIGYEISAKYIEIANQRVGSQALRMFDYA